MTKPAARRARKPRVAPRLGRPPGADAEATRTVILEAALEAFATSGYEAVSVRELTRRLGFSHNLVHHHFGSKQKLWLATLDHAFGERVGDVVADLEAAIDDESDPFDAVASTIRALVALFAALPALPSLLAQEAAWEEGRLDEVAARYFQPFFGVAERLAVRIEQAGGVRVDLRSLALTALTACGSLFTHAAMARRIGGPEPFSAEAVAAHAETVVTLLVEGLRGARD